MKVLIIGGTGFIGSHLAQAVCGAGHAVTVVGSRPAPAGNAKEAFDRIQADTTRTGPWQEAVAQSDLIVNLAGRTISHRWTERYKQQIYDSRILTTRHLVNALPNPCRSALISASAVGYYGDGGETELHENAPAGNDFLAGLAKDWEAAALAASAKGARVVIARFGIVLGREGGALAAMLPAFRKFMGGPLGSGRQWFPWVHIRDLVAAIRFLADHADLSGPFNLCAPHPVRNAELARSLGRVLGRPAKMAAPAFMLKMMFGELADALLASQRAVPVRLLAAGFNFGFNELDAALSDLILSQPNTEV
jgi:uncharacterized protein (TIGR01777 family)